jgi:predicted Fe-Mo cluster-binding NifX family protein
LPNTMKVALAHWQGRIAPVFDVSDNVYLIQCAGGREIKREPKTLNHHDPFSRAREVTGLGTQVLICGAVSSPLETALAASGVRVIGFVCGDLEAVLRAYLSGSLHRPCFRMPGWVPQGRPAHCRRSRHRTLVGMKWEKTERG